MKKKTLLAILCACFALSAGLCACDVNDPETPPDGDNPSIVQPETPKISIATTTYNYADDDLVLTVTNLNKATTVTLKRGMSELDAETYAKSEDSFTIKKSYLSTLNTGSYTFTLQTDIGNVVFTVRVPEPPAGVPSVTPSSVKYEIADLTGEVTFEVDYNRGFFESLKLNGQDADDNGYSTSPSGITFSKSYLVSLGVGVHEFTLTTDGGNCTFTVELTRDKLSFDGNEYTVTAGQDLQIPLYGTAGKDLTVTLGGAPLAATAYTVANDKLTLNSSYLETLASDVYAVEVTANDEYAKTYVVSGLTASELFFVDFEEFGAPVGSADYLSLGKATDARGTYGTIGITAGAQSTLFKSGDGNLNYSFKNGTTYEFSMDIKVPDDAKPANATPFLILLFKTTAGGSADIGHLRVSQSGYQYVVDGAGKSMTLVDLGDGWYRYIVRFDWSNSYSCIEVPYWNVASCYLDNIKILPSAGAGVLAVPSDINFVTPHGAEVNKTLTFGEGVSVLGVKVGDDWAGDKATVSGNSVTFAGSWLKTLEKAANVPFTVYTNKCTVFGSVSVPSTDATLEGASYHYLNDGNDMTFTLNAAGNTVSQIQLDNYTAKSNEYTLSGTTLTLKASLLNRISQTGTLKVKFAGGGELTKQLTSKRLLQVDFDDFAKPASGFSYVNMDDEVVTTGGINGNSGRFTSNSAVAGFVAFGGSFVPVELTAGHTYRLSMKIKMESVNPSINGGFEGTMLMVIKFNNPGQDVGYIRNEGDSHMELRVQHDTRMVNSSCTLNTNGYYDIVMDFEMRDGDASPLQFEVWTACSFLVDDIVLAQL